ncbi:MAG: hypothetical protein V1929_05255 [bacterium]
MLTAEYRDKYGSLGRIAVLSGFKRGSVIDADVWVMSCRAFSRRIEHQTLAFLFDKTGACEIEFDFQQTGKNTILREFMDRYTSPEGGRRVCRRAAFLQAAPRTYFMIKEGSYGV